MHLKSGNIINTGVKPWREIEDIARKTTGHGWSHLHCDWWDVAISLDKEKNKTWFIIYGIKNRKLNKARLFVERTRHTITSNQHTTKPSEQLYIRVL